MTLMNWLFPQLAELNGKLSTVIRQNRALLNLQRDNQIIMERTMATAKEVIAQLVRESAELKTVKDSVVSAVSVFVANAQNALDAGDMATLQSLVTEFDASSKEIANAVANNTPVSNEPEPSSSTPAPAQPVVNPEPTPTPAPEPTPTTETPNP